MDGSLSLAGQIAVVTGGSTGIGRAVCRHLAAAGAAVAINYLDDDAGAAALAAELKQAGAAAWTCRADVSDPSQVQRLFACAEEVRGGVNICVANAGIQLVGALLTAALTRTMALELASHGITVNAVAPGATLTAMNAAVHAGLVLREAVAGRIPAGRWGRPE